MDIQNTLSRLLNAGLTQVEIGKAINRSQATISEMATGKSGCTRPSADVVIGLEGLLQKHLLNTNKN